MKARIVALVLVVGVAAIACAPNQGEDALSDARQVCIDFGYGDDESEESSDDNTGTTTSADLAELTDGMDKLVNQAARAARLDRRWDRLSNTVTDIQEWAEQTTTALDDTQPELDRDSAKTQADKLDPSNLRRVMRQECRKALAE